MSIYFGLFSKHTTFIMLNLKTTHQFVSSCCATASLCTIRDDIVAAAAASTNMRKICVFERQATPCSRESVYRGTHCEQRETAKVHHVNRVNCNKYIRQKNRTRECLFYVSKIFGPKSMKLLKSMEFLNSMMLI